MNVFETQIHLVSLKSMGGEVDADGEEVREGEAWGTDRTRSFAMSNFGIVYFNDLSLITRMYAIQFTLERLYCMYRGMISKILWFIQKSS